MDLACVSLDSVMELVDAAVPVQQLEPIKQTILQVDGVKVSFILNSYCPIYMGVRVWTMSYSLVH